MTHKLPVPFSNPSNAGSTTISTSSSKCLNKGAIPSNVEGVDCERSWSSGGVRAGGGEVRRVMAILKWSEVKKSEDFAISQVKVVAFTSRTSSPGFDSSRGVTANERAKASSSVKFSI